MRYLVFALAMAATATLAHEGVQNPAVLERMNGMSAIAKGVETIGQMAKGTTAFDRSRARAAAAEIARHASEAPALFEAQENDPKSEALPAIWKNFDDFTARSLELETLATELSGSISTPEDLRTALRDLGNNCKSCHEIYRK